LPPTQVTVWCASGYMLENLCIPRYEYRPSGRYRDNVSGAENQQERLVSADRFRLRRAERDASHGGSRGCQHASQRPRSEFGSASATDQNPQRPYARGPGHWIMRWSHLHGDMQEQHMLFASSSCRSKVKSEIPCRVSSDLHEWRNDFSAVSTRSSVKLQSR